MNRKKKAAQIVFMDYITDRMEELAVMKLNNPFMSNTEFGDLESAL